MLAREQMLELKDRVSRSIIGQEHVVERLLLALLANGNVLMEGLPGLAKPRAIKTLARHIKSEFRRIQFTPDLLPSDITGTEVLTTAKAAAAPFGSNPAPFLVMWCWRTRSTGPRPRCRRRS